MATPAQAHTSVPPSAQVLQMAFGYQLARSVYMAAKLGIADLLRNGAKSADDLAAATGCNADALYRMLRALASVGMFSEGDARNFELTALAQPLRSDVPDSIRAMVLFAGNQLHWTVYGEFEHCLATGKNAVEKAFGMAPFEYIVSHPEDAKIFNDAMRSHSGMSIPAIVEGYDYSQFECIADIAGGQGHLLAALLSEHQRTKGILFDLPEAIEDAKRVNLLPNPRAELIEGDFFKSVPTGADAYILKHIIHDWADTEAIQILRNCREAIPDSGKLLVVEMMLPGRNEPGFAKFLDLEMLVIPGGRERTAEEYAALLEAAGFRLNQVIATRSPIGIFEATPV
ncbi:MAG TPA: methyltransferase [Bryobacteraceae bacterium]|nr:methyltransferase [Bryobacteraceae bacterium]